MHGRISLPQSPLVKGIERKKLVEITWHDFPGKSIGLGPLC